MPRQPGNHDNHFAPQRIASNTARDAFPWRTVRRSLIEEIPDLV
jgi:hypothetical protein